MELSVVIVNYKVRYFLELCLQSVQDAIVDLDAEIIVVDNASSDDSCSMVRHKFPSITLIENKDNLGFSKANNIGVAFAKGKYVLILNPDTVVAENTFVKALEFVKKQQNFGALGVKLIDGVGRFLPESKRGIPTPKVSFYKLFGKSVGKYYANHIGENESGKVDVLVGAFMLMERTVYNEVEGFDEAYFMYGEDIDLSYKILKKGYENYYFSGTQVIHYKGESTVKDAKYLYYFIDAMKIFYKKHFSSNVFYDFMMKLGLKFWYLFKFFGFKRKAKMTESSKNVLCLCVENDIVVNLQKIETIKNVVEFNNTNDIAELKNCIQTNNINEIVFDNNYLTYLEIIELINELKQEDLTFKINPKNTNFIIGSNSSETRGELIILN
jgi:GT2 family glycosyltransferase|tara:strand:+ start:2342 stop:3490 length:1149 start_codon:yes stop_codon:yes gene_type:complete